MPWYLLHSLLPVNSMEAQCSSGGGAFFHQCAAVELSVATMQNQGGSAGPIKKSCYGRKLYVGAGSCSKPPFVDQAFECAAQLIVSANKKASIRQLVTAMLAWIIYGCGM